MHSRDEKLKIAIDAALMRLNGLYGKGDVASFSTFADGTGEVQINVPHCYAYTRKFRVENGTLYYAGHQQKLKLD
jgi:hypothetical protein